MKKKLPVIIGLAAVVLFSFWYAHKDVAHLLYDNNVNTAQYAEIGILYDGDVVTQTFTAEEDEIDAFMIKANTSGDHAKIELSLTVTDNETGEQVSSGEESGANVRARKLHRFAVDPITNCRGKEFTLTLREKNSWDNNGIVFYYQPAETKDSGLKINGQATQGVFVMKTLTRRFDAESFIVMAVSLLTIWGFLWFLGRLFR